MLLRLVSYFCRAALAAMLDPQWGVDIIIGGHSHTFLDQPAEVNNILIAQAGVGTDQIGRFDIVVDDDTNSITEWKWQLLPVDSNLAEPDPEIEKLIEIFKDEVDRKYNRLVGRLARKLIHPRREEETELGNLFADIFAQQDSLDVAFTASGAIRGTELGPLVTLSDLKKIYPYDDVFYKLKVTGAVLTKIFAYIMRLENRVPGESEYLQVNKGVKAVYRDAEEKLESLSIHGKPVQDDAQYTIAMDGYRYQNAFYRLGVTEEELTQLGNPKVITTSCQDVLEEYFGCHQNLNSQIEGRLVYK
ncbi:5'-nucleotidase C-terminal domain-containing protein [Nostoc sp.]|uniref:5'-nucleotidase C-terminal domain-containing protein n=1 Tax=Nostoc sp. TaxID=1180 RepID=UPI002FFA712C